MNFFVIFTYLVIFSVDYLAKKLGLISIYFVLVPELLSGFAVLYIIARVVAGKRIQVDWRYGLFFSLLFLTMLIGIAAQTVPSGAVVTGLRDQIRYLPFFLLPAVYDFSARQLKTQAIVLMALLAVQIPVVLFQRFFQFSATSHTGDAMTGTAATSSALSMLMICGIAVLVVLYLRKRIAMPVLFIAGALFLLPTALNETKGTLVLLPFAMLVPFFVMRRGERPFQKLLPLVVFFVVGGTAFINIYNHYLQYAHPGGSIESFYTDGGIVDYMYKNTAEGDHRVGRVDSIEMAIIRLGEDPLTAAFGLGVGNVSEAILPGFEGNYSGYYDRYKVSFTQISYLLWELGAAGLIVYGLFYFWMCRDAFFLARTDNEFTLLGQIWAPIMLIMTLALGYKSFFTMNEIVYPFAFLSGVVATKVYALRRERRRERRRATAKAAPSGWGVAEPASAVR